jgi:hypothetical protein
MTRGFVRGAGLTTSVAFQVRPEINGRGGADSVACGPGATPASRARSVSISL